MTYEDLINKKREPDRDLMKTVDRVFEKFTHNLKEACDKADKVLIIGDYDCDGIMSSLILSRAIENFCDKQVSTYITDRFNDGYGIPKDMKFDKGTLVVCADLGSGESKNKFERIINETGIAPVIIDHHEMGDDLNPNYKYLLNFNAFTKHEGYKKEYDIPDYCTSGLAFKIYFQMYKQLFVENKTMLDAYVEAGLETQYRTMQAFASIGTIADMVSVNSICDDNKKIILDGFRAMEGNNLEYGAHYLIKNICKADVEHMTTEKVQFSIAPVINSAGRMTPNGGQIIFNALNADTKEEIKEGLDKLRSLNNKRKEAVRKIEESSSYAKEISKSSGVYVNEDIPQGIIGIIAQKLVKETGRPYVVITKPDVQENKEYIASARNAEGYPSMFEILQGFYKYKNFGGHDDALGFSIAKSNIKLFKDFFVNAYKDVSIVKTEKDYANAKDFDAEKLLALEPFGVDFPKVLVLQEANIKDVKYLSGGYMSLTDQDGTRFFGEKNTEIKRGDTIPISGTLSYNEYKDYKGMYHSSVQVNIKEVLDKTKDIGKETEETEKNNEEIEKC